MMVYKTKKMSTSTQTVLHRNSSMGETQANTSKEVYSKKSSTLAFQIQTCQDQRAILRSMWNALISQKTLSLLRIRGRQASVKQNPLSQEVHPRLPILAALQRMESNVEASKINRNLNHSRKQLKTTINEVMHSLPVRTTTFSTMKL